MWRVPIQRRRCLVPMDGFYEWKKIDAKTKQPYAFAMLDGCARSTAQDRLRSNKPTALRISLCIASPIRR